jgi:hypothetical protein
MPASKVRQFEVEIPADDARVEEYPKGWTAGEPLKSFGTENSEIASANWKSISSNVQEALLPRCTFIDDIISNFWQFHNLLAAVWPHGLWLTRRNL